MTAQTPETKLAKRKMQRSPNYPGIDLETALQRARALYEREGRHAVPLTLLVQHWGYSAKSSVGMVALAALKKFGLLEVTGSGAGRSFSLTPLALKIVLDDRPESVERDAAIKEAALKPAIHVELWEKYGGSLPSDDNLRHYLRVERQFADNTVGDFIAEFRRTIAFAKLGNSGTLSESQTETETQGSDTQMTASGQTMVPAGAQAAEAPQPASARSTSVAPAEATLDLYALPLGENAKAFLRVPPRISRKMWNRMLAVLKAMEPALVEESQEDGAAAQSEEGEQ